MLLNTFSRNRRRKNNNCEEPRWQSQSDLVWLLAMSWFRRKISLVPSIKIIVLSTLLAPATLIITHTATKIHTLRPHWQMSYFFKIAQRVKLAKKVEKQIRFFCGFMLVLNEETWLALFGLSIERHQLFTTLNVMGGFFLLFDVTMDISQGKFISGQSRHTHHAIFPL